MARPFAYLPLVVATAVYLGVRPAHERYFGVAPANPDPEALTHG